MSDIIKLIDLWIWNPLAGAFALALLVIALMWWNKIPNPTIHNKALKAAQIWEERYWEKDKESKAAHERLEKSIDALAWMADMLEHIDNRLNHLTPRQDPPRWRRPWERDR